MRDAREGLAEFIRENGYKQTAIAKKVGLTDTQLCDIIHKRRHLNTEEMLRFCEVLNVCPNDLFAENRGEEEWKSNGSREE